MKEKNKEKKIYPGRDENGRFVKGHNIGEATRFAPDNDMSLKYKDEYGEIMIRYFQEEAGYPTFELFAEEIGVTDSTLRVWCETYPRFGGCYKRCKNIQKGKLVKGGVENRFNPAFSKFVAINCHGMNDKVTTDNTVTFNVQLTDEIDQEAN